MYDQGEISQEEFDRLRSLLGDQVGAGSAGEAGNARAQTGRSQDEEPGNEKARPMISSRSAAPVNSLPHQDEPREESDPKCRSQ
jgi:hypothetical protein